MAFDFRALIVSTSGLACRLTSKPSMEWTTGLPATAGIGSHDGLIDQQGVGALGTVGNSDFEYVSIGQF